MRRLLLALSLILPLSACRADTPPQTLAAIQNGSHVLIDVRTSEEFAAGHLQGARLIPHYRIGAEISALAPDKNTPIVLYCRSGRRSNIARQTLLQLGYTQVVDAGSYEQLKADLAAAGADADACSPTTKC
ncbi:rhodanese-like domain-containing protein [Pseudomonas sp. MAP12]|uniref:Rhodanese-like domain-containing protein n=2 Tax=Geopseudomonas aromaticivorans TaxID=2849492 RepID=A0ABS6MW74_9GAMM|nr:rhodanese-like domain-containing protein [Pseudomonas aromaticivorans]